MAEDFPDVWTLAGWHGPPPEVEDALWAAWPENSFSRKMRWHEAVLSQHPFEDEERGFVVEVLWPAGLANWVPLAHINRAAAWERRRKRRWRILGRRRPSRVATCDCPVDRTRRRRSGCGWTSRWPRPRRPRRDDRRRPQRRDHRLRSLQRDNYPSPRSEHQPTCRRRRDD